MWSLGVTVAVDTEIPVSRAEPAWEPITAAAVRSSSCTRGGTWGRVLTDAVLGAVPMEFFFRNSCAGAMIRKGNHLLWRANTHSLVSNYYVQPRSAHGS